MAMAAEDPAPSGSVWIGTFKRFGVGGGASGPPISSTDAVIRFAEREGEKYKAELWLDNRTKGLVLEGTIIPSGGMKGSPTKILNGEFAPDIIGRAQFIGSAKKGAIKLRYQIPNGVRFGEIEVKLKKS